MRALAFICARVTRRSTRPTPRDGRINRGRMATAARVRRHSMPSITASIAPAVNRFEATDTKVPVIACWAPTTSLLSRDMSSPGRLPVKKAKDIRCKCP